MMGVYIRGTFTVLHFILGLLPTLIQSANLECCLHVYKIHLLTKEHAGSRWETDLKLKYKAVNEPSIRIIS